MMSVPYASARSNSSTISTRKRPAVQDGQDDLRTNLGGSAQADGQGATQHAGKPAEAFAAAQAAVSRRWT